MSRTAYLVVHVDTASAQLIGWGIYSEFPMTQYGAARTDALLLQVESNSYAEARGHILGALDADLGYCAWALARWGRPE